MSARDRAKLDMSIRIQKAYRHGHEAGGTATKELQGEVASLQEDNNTLRSQLKLAGSPRLHATTTGHLKLSPGDLPCAADKRAPEC